MNPQRAFRIRAVAADSGDAQHCLEAYYAELAGILADGFDPALTLLPGPADIALPPGLFLVAYVEDQPVGCIGFKWPPGQ